MIPKTIHYCWFGYKPLSPLSIKCIESWKKYFPDYEIKEWNEENFDINCCNYIKEAYKSQKWAFVSDYARFKILYEYGGIYFDTDVEIIKDMTEVIEAGAFMGSEPNVNLGREYCLVAPGLGLAAEPKMDLYKEIIEFYDVEHFVYNDGSLNEKTVVEYTTNILKKHGYNCHNKIAEVSGIIIYPPEYFCPQNFETGELTITEHTYSIHHYSASWLTSLDRIVKMIERCKNKNTVQYKIRRIISLPFRVVNKIKKRGMKNTIKGIYRRF